MIGELARKAWQGMTRNVAFTAPNAGDERLRGRTYAIPFEDVWQGSLHLVGGGLRGWQLLEHDDHEGIIRGLARGPFGILASSITIRISLDLDAQTRVDALSASRSGRADLGVNARRLGRFFRRLDARLMQGRGRRASRRQVTGA